MFSKTIQGLSPLSLICLPCVVLYCSTMFSQSQTQNSWPLPEHCPLGVQSHIPVHLATIAPAEENNKVDEGTWFKRTGVGVELDTVVLCLLNTLNQLKAIRRITGKYGELHCLLFVIFHNTNTSVRAIRTLLPRSPDKRDERRRVVRFVVDNYSETRISPDVLHHTASFLTLGFLTVGQETLYYSRYLDILGIDAADPLIVHRAKRHPRSQEIFEYLQLHAASLDTTSSKIQHVEGTTPF